MMTESTRENVVEKLPRWRDRVLNLSTWWDFRYLKAANVVGTVTKWRVVRGDFRKEQEWHRCTQ